VRPIAKPGERRIYSDQGFEVIGETLARNAEMPFADYLRAAVLEPLGLDARYDGPAGLRLARIARRSARDSARAARADAGRDGDAREATSVQFPGSSACVPGFGRQEPNDWGLGFELRDAKSPHWTGSRNSPRTFGHFGRSGTFLWVDPEAGLALGCLTDHDFGDWAKTAWPALSDAVLEA
jgi:CubicO group peptidase (beta-lactamase class C family)